MKRNLNSNVSSITKIHREIFTRMYPTKVILADGASINIRYHEPRKIIKVRFSLHFIIWFRFSNITLNIKNVVLMI